MRESTIEHAACKFARDNGCMVMKLSGPCQKGQPDRMFLKAGSVLFIEFKAPGKRPTALQEKWSSDLGEQGFISICCDNLENAKWNISNLLLNR